MSLIAVLMVASVITMLASTIGAVALGKGPSRMWSVIMFVGMGASYLTVGGLVAELYLTTGKLYPILAFVPFAMTWAALRAYKQSRAKVARVE